MPESTIARAEFVPLGGDLRGYYALPAGDGPFPAVLLFQEAFGVNEYIQSEVRRLAEHGYAAISPDLFRGETFDYTNFEAAMGAMGKLTDDSMLADTDACIAFLKAQPQVKSDTFGCIGFCMGGRMSFLVATHRADQFVAASSFYGGGIADGQRWPSLLPGAGNLKGEMLLVYGADDDHIPPTEHSAVANALSEQKKRYTLSVYPGAPHGFASKDRPSYRPEQAEAAWTESLDMFARTLK
jgi:carboxymethylenebutenolidase